MAVARLSLALAPHSRHVWIACGPGNNGGDGFVAATDLHRWTTAKGLNKRITVSFHGQETRLPDDARWALARMRASGLDLSPPPADGEWDLAIDALLGIGCDRLPSGNLLSPWAALRRSARPVLSVDVPSGLQADCGAWPQGDVPPAPPGAERHTLSLLSLKPGLFTASGRDAAGHIWYDDLGTQAPDGLEPSAWLCGRGPAARPERPHASHKGSFGDVIIVGGQSPSRMREGMTGAAILAARAALHAGAGRVYVSIVGAKDGSQAVSWDPGCPELMFRHTDQIVADSHMLEAFTSSIVCGCGGGQGIRSHLPALLSRACKIVLDADALNAVAGDEALQHLLAQRGRHRGKTTVLTPHPLEAARLLGRTTTQVQANRLGSAVELAERFAALVVLKGSGTIIAGPGDTPWINSSGNAWLATAGTGDVLAGMIGAALAEERQTGAIPEVVRQAVWRHGHLADNWPQPGPRLTAGVLAALGG